MGTKRYPKYVAEAPGGLDARSFGNIRARGYTKLEWPKMVKNEDGAANEQHIPKKKKKK